VAERSKAAADDLSCFGGDGVDLPDRMPAGVKVSVGFRCARGGQGQPLLAKGGGA
jgi:hypothetical protein